MVPLGRGVPPPIPRGDAGRLGSGPALGPTYTTVSSSVG